LQLRNHFSPGAYCTLVYNRGGVVFGAEKHMAWIEGDRVGPYIIVDHLGAGGMATVLKAHHPDLNRYVAIKVMHSSFMSDPSFQQRFQREAQIVAGLEHPNIVPVYDFQQHEGSPYLVMKYIEGETLKDRMSRGPLSLNEVLHIIRSVGSGLAYAHRRGVLHRDIKPSNIIIDRDNTVYITDFGLARIAEAGESTMSADMLLGTPHYISPEQARGVKNLDGRADLYSLGIVLYELMVGRVPFSAETPYAIVHDHIYTPLPMPAAINPEIPSEVEAVIIRSLAKSAEDRYATADHLVGDLEQAVAASNLKTLNPNRANQAAISLARLREEMIPGATASRPPAIGAPLTPTGSFVSLNEESDHKTGRRWMIGGLIVFVVGCFTTVGFGLSVAAGVGELAEQSDPVGLTMEFNSGELYVVPALSHTQAQERIDQQPDDEIAYLALARASWDESLPRIATQAINEGLITTQEPTRYLLTAAQIAQDAEEPDAALAYAILAFSAAEDADDLALARSYGGLLLYESALTGEAIDTAALSERLFSQAVIDRYDLNTSIVRLMTARRLITTENYILAQRQLATLDEGADDLAETQLIRGELAAAQGNNETARDHWGTIMADEDAPQWVRDRAEALLETTEE
jgi:serine/threonine protein kinase